MSRTATITRTTKETDIAMTLSLDGSGKSKISTGIGFFDHMLDGFTRHGLFDMKLSVKEISMWTPTIRSKIPESCSAMRSARQSVTKRHKTLRTFHSSDG